MVFANFSNITNSKFRIWCTLSTLVNPDKFLAWNFVWQFFWNFLMLLKNYLKCVSQSSVKSIFYAISLSKLSFFGTCPKYIKIFFSIVGRAHRTVRKAFSPPLFPTAQIWDLYASCDFFSLVRCKPSHMKIPF